MLVRPTGDRVEGLTLRPWSPCRHYIVSVGETTARAGRPCPAVRPGREGVEAMRRRQGPGWPAGPILGRPRRCCPVNAKQGCVLSGGRGSREGEAPAEPKTRSTHRLGRSLALPSSWNSCYTAPAEDGRLSLRESTVFRGAKDDDDVTKPTGGSIACAGWYSRPRITQGNLLAFGHRIARARAERGGTRPRTRLRRHDRAYA